jgi:5-(carboxyamino)imidazole ribonucleotide synthase
VTPILPGSIIGILGGGQLGRMFGIAARRMGYRVHAFDPTPDSPTGQVADVEIAAPYDDIEAARYFASRCDVVTMEFENIPSRTVEAVAELRPVRPSANVLHVCQHRQREKEFLTRAEFAVAPYRAVRSESELRAAVEALGPPCVLKTAGYGYDGKGQTRIDTPASVADAWRTLAAAHHAEAGVVEKFVRFDRELSVVVARTPDGQTGCFPVAENEHRRHILDTSVAPAQIEPPIAARAQQLAADIAIALDVVGLLTVEMFLLPDGELVVNELAPRPHNSGHWSFDACVTSQFEQQLRAVCGLPLGDPSLLRPAAIANLLGDLWIAGEPRWDYALAIPSVKLHLYGKAQPRPGRKMGHLCATAETPGAALEAVRRAREALEARA